MVYQSSFQQKKIEATRYFNKILKLFSTFNTGATGLNNG